MITFKLNTLIFSITISFGLASSVFTLTSLANTASANLTKENTISVNIEATTTKFVDGDRIVFIGDSSLMVGITIKIFFYLTRHVIPIKKFVITMREFQGILPKEHLSVLTKTLRVINRP